MNKNIAISTIIAMSMFLPSIARAQYSGYGWYGEPAINPSGPPDIIFPVQGGATFTDDFSDPRSGHTHEGNDLKAPKMTWILAARGGRVVFAPTSQPAYGYMITIAGDDGYRYSYIHINNDTPGTDDGNGGPQNAYAPGIEDGVNVTQGQHIAWVGDSGNAESTVSHLHFEIRQPDGTAINPYPYLIAVYKSYAYDVAGAKAASPSIDADKGLLPGPTTTPPCIAGSLIRTAASPSVYYCGADGRRYVFPNARTYATWYSSFASVQIITSEAMADVRLGGNVTYRPGVKLVKIQTDPKVYAVSKNGTLRWVTSSALAASYYGSAWAKNVDDVPDAFFTNYTIGDPINQ